MQTGKTGAEAQAEALSSLCSREPKQLLVKQAVSGKRLLHHLYQQFCISGLIPLPTASDDVQRLHALFSVATQHGLANIIVDYVFEVCLDAALTSDDATDASLMEGECVSSWVDTALADSGRTVRQALQSDLSAEHCQTLKTELCCTSGLVHIAQALQPSGQRAQSSSLQTAIRLQQCAKVSMWVIRQGLHQGRHSGRHASRQEWAMADKKRRDASLGSTFLQDAVARLQEIQGAVSGLHYPPESMGAALSGLFLTGSTSDDAFRTKLRILLYALLDCGHNKVMPSFGSCFGLTNQQLSEQHVFFLLDESLLGQPGSIAVETACSILPEVANSSMPFKVVEVLAAVGKPAVALRVWNACGWSCLSDPDVNLRNTGTAVSIMLNCGLTSKALVEITKHANRASPERKHRDTASLIQHLAEWASANSKLADVVKLPFQQQQEKALLGWLRQKSDEGNDNAGTVLVLYLLQRQRFTEAMQAFEQIRAVADPASKAGEARECVAELLRAAKQLLPECQRRLSTSLSPVAKVEVHSSRQSSQHIENAPGSRVQQKATQGLPILTTGPDASLLPLYSHLCAAK